MGSHPAGGDCTPAKDEPMNNDWTIGSFICDTNNLVRGIILSVGAIQCGKTAVPAVLVDLGGGKTTLIPFDDIHVIVK
jgi:hypothetical protein